MKKKDLKGGKVRQIRVQLRGTKEGAIGMPGPSGTVWVQFNRIDHPHAGGWHLYPRHHFHRRK